MWIYLLVLGPKWSTIRSWINRKLLLFYKSTAIFVLFIFVWSNFFFKRKHWKIHFFTKKERIEHCCSICNMLHRPFCSYPPLLHGDGAILNVKYAVCFLLSCFCVTFTWTMKWCHEKGFSKKNDHSVIRMTHSLFFGECIFCGFKTWSRFPKQI